MEELMERMSAAAAALERVAEQMAERQIALAAETEQSVGRIVATVEGHREAELAERLWIAEDKLAIGRRFLPGCRRCWPSRGCRPMRCRRGGSRLGRWMRR